MRNITCQNRIQFPQKKTEYNDIMFTGIIIYFPFFSLKLVEGILITCLTKNKFISDLLYEDLWKENRHHPEHSQARC